MKMQNSVIQRSAKIFLTILIACGIPVNSIAGDFGPTHNGKYDRDSKLTTLIMESDFIFKGTLNDISYGLAIENIPYTFLTYSVDEVIAGNYQGNNLTIKFVGGEYPNGDTLTASNAPQVTFGEEAVLFINQNASDGCDFARCENGRFLLDNNGLLDAYKSPVTLGSKGPKSEGIQKADFSQFKSHLVNLNKGHGGPKGSVRNLDINEPFHAHEFLFKAAPGPKARKISSPVTNNTGGQKGRPSTAEEQRELEMLKQNNGDPVFK